MVTVYVVVETYLLIILHLLVSNLEMHIFKTDEYNKGCSQEATFSGSGNCWHKFGSLEIQPVCDIILCNFSRVYRTQTYARSVGVFLPISALALRFYKSERGGSPRDGYLYSEAFVEYPDSQKLPA